MMEYVAGSGGNPLAGAALGLHNHVDRRYMPPTTWAEVHNLYCLMRPESNYARGSLKLLQTVYKECWEPILGFRHVGQHAMCTTCARLAKTRRDSPDMAERQHADNEYKAHLNECLRHAQGGHAIRQAERCVLRAWLHFAESMLAYPH